MGVWADGTRCDNEAASMRVMRRLLHTRCGSREASSHLLGHPPDLTQPAFNPKRAPRLLPARPRRTHAHLHLHECPSRIPLPLTVTDHLWPTVGWKL